MNTDSLFKPFRLKSLNLRNRFVMSPMTRSFSPGGIPTDDVAQYYKRRAEGEVGLIISEGTVIDRPAAAQDPNVPARVLIFSIVQPAISGNRNLMPSRQ